MNKSHTREQMVIFWGGAGKQQEENPGFFSFSKVDSFMMGIWKDLYTLPAMGEQIDLLK